MIRTRTRWLPFVAVLMLVGLRPVLAAGQTVVIQVENDARIPATDLAQVERLVESSYLSIGVRMIWEHGEVPLDDPRGLRVHVRLLSRTRADRKITTERIRGDVLGQTNRPARIVYIFCNRIVEASVKYSKEYTRILGFVVAHELGHVLLPAGSHSDAAMMNGRTNLWAKPSYDFTPEEGAAIRTMLLVE